MDEAGVAAKLKEKNRQFLIKSVSDKFGYGTPDRILLLKGQGSVIWAELKFLKALPKNHCKVGLKKKQGAFLAEWAEEGGNSCLIIGVASEKKVVVVTDGFRRIALEGMKREEFVMIGYEEVGQFLKDKFVR